jgi:hypothetical protein
LAWPSDPILLNFKVTIAGFIWIMRFFADPLAFFGPEDNELCSSTTEAGFPPSAPAPAVAPVVFV